MLGFHFFELLRLFFQRFKDIEDKDKAQFLAFVMAAVFLLFSAQFSGDLNDNRRIWFFLGLSAAVLEIFLREPKIINDGSKESNN